MNLLLLLSAFLTALTGAFAGARVPAAAAEQVASAPVATVVEAVTARRAVGRFEAASPRLPLIFGELERWPALGLIVRGERRRE